MYTLNFPVAYSIGDRSRPIRGPNFIQDGETKSKMVPPAHDNTGPIIARDGKVKRAALMKRESQPSLIWLKAIWLCENEH